MAEYEPRNFIQPCLLLLLRERSDHGYDLIDRLRELHAVDGDAGVVYRALRSLEKAGMVRSSWEASDAGPARRTYRLTTLGVATLDRQADVLEQTHRTLHLFRHRYELLVGCAATTNGAGTNGSRTYAAAPMPAPVGGSRGNGRNGHGSGTAGGGTGDPGDRGVRPPRPPRQRTGG
jgi:poly-beta-hydroxybutyrate-responsive repressor